jgi:hypothetical protein
MKRNLPKILFIFSIFSFIVILELTLFAYPTGFTGLTRHTSGVGCVCHGGGVSHSDVTVNFIGPDSVATGQTVMFRLKTSHGPAVEGGLDVAVSRGRLDTTAIEPIVRKDTIVGELTHRQPKSFSNDTVSWRFLYTAPNTAGYDTLWAVSNSVNGNNLADTADHWNFSDDHLVRIYVPIGIQPISSIAESFSLKQNYPNPFNPSTQIEFSVSKRENVMIKVYDIKGAEVETLLNESLKTGSYKVSFDGAKLTSGIYFYRIIAGDFTDTKKMMLIK